MRQEAKGRAGLLSGLLTIAIVSGLVASCASSKEFATRAEVEEKYGRGMMSFPRINEYSYYDKSSGNTVVVEYKMAKSEPSEMDEVTRRILVQNAVDYSLDKFLKDVKETKIVNSKGEEIEVGSIQRDEISVDEISPHMLEVLKKDFFVDPQK